MNNLDKLKQKALELLEQKLKESKTELSGAHSKSHLTITANLTQLMAKIYKFSDRESFLVYFAALFHDIVRSPSQDKDLKDEQLSAKEALKIIENFQVSEEEKEAISYAIINHGNNPTWMENPKKRENLPNSLKEKLHFALYVSDKIEQNGVRSIARRSAFVGGERLHKENGDLKEFGFKKGQDEALVVVIEGILRLTFINPEDIYPKKLKIVLKPLYFVQRQFVCALLKSLNLKVKDIARVILSTKRADGKNLKEVRRIRDISSPKKFSDLIRSVGKITDLKIQSQIPETIKASLEALNYFSSNYEKDIDLLMLNWKPQNKLAKEWQRQMIEYLNGKWLNSLVIPDLIRDPYLYRFRVKHGMTKV